MENLESFLTVRLPRLLEATAAGRGAGELYQVEIEGAGTWTLDLRKGARVAAGEAGQGACRIALSTQTAEQLVAEPRSLWTHFLEGSIRIDEGCSAAELAQAVWPGVLEESVPAPLARALFHPQRAPEPSACEMRSGPLVEHTYVQTVSGLVRVAFAEVNGLAVIEGDIVLGTAEAMRRVAEAVERNEDSAGLRALRIIDLRDPTRYVWPQKTMPYTIDPGMPDQQRIHDAMAHISGKLPITFRQRTSEPDWVKFFQGDGCWSFVGRQGGQQDLSLAAGCSTGNTIHEITHALGMWHEQQRFDRASYVTINTGNIEAGKEGNFDPLKAGTGKDLDGYDYLSIMHYGAYAFAKTDKKGKYVGPTIQCKDASYQDRIGQRDALSDGDVSGLKAIYP